VSKELFHFCDVVIFQKLKTGHTEQCSATGVAWHKNKKTVLSTTFLVQNMHI